MEESECRACMKKGACISVFSDHNNHDTSISEMLTACATVSISPEDEYSKQICIECNDALEIAYAFRRRCEATYEYLINTFNECIKKEQDETNECENTSANVEYGWIKLEDAKSDYSDDAPVVSESHCSNKVIKSILRKRIRKAIKEKLNASKSEEKKPPDTKKPRKKYQCSYCPKAFRSNFKLGVHEDVHLGIKRYFCDICQKHFRNEEDHKRLHKNGFKYKCEHCEKVFNTDQKLKQHVLVHDTNREKSFVCEVEGCNRSYLSFAALYTHKKRHHSQENGRRVCDICSKVLGSDHALKEHLARHAAKKQFKCSYCDKEYFTKHALRCHELYHVEKKFTCDECNKRFVFKHMLQRHMKLHQEYTESCRFCDKKFARSDYIKRHERKEHASEMNANK